MYLQDSTSIFSGIPLLAVFSALVYLGIIAMVVVGFIFLIKFLRAGTKAFNLYVQKNAQINEKRNSDDKNGL